MPVWFLDPRSAALFGDWCILLKAKWNVEQENTKYIANIRRIVIDCLLVGGIIILVPSLQFVLRLVRMLYGNA